MFDPVSPSGTGIHVEAVDLVDVRLEVGDGGPEGLEQPGPVAGPPGHQATSVPLSARSRRTDGRRVRDDRDRRGSPAGWTRRPSTWIDEALDLASERSVDGVADGRIDLASDLGDRHAEGDLEVELDLDAAGEADREPGLGEVEARRGADPPGRRRSR